MTGQIIFIIWRESIEALLVIGILHNWLGRAGGQGRGYLWAGVGAGIGLSLLMAYSFLRFAETLSEDAQDKVMTATVFLAAALIVQMVAWMRANGRTLKGQLHRGLDSALQSGRLWGVFTLAMIAVAREGSETVVFLYGLLAASSGTGVVDIAQAIAVGFAAALLSYGLLQLGGRIMPWRVFFRLSETMLLALGNALVVTGAGKLVSLGLLPYTDPVWNTGWLLDDTSRFGSLVAALTGYRSEPDLVTLGVWVCYAAVLLVVLRPRPVARKAMP